MYMRGRGREGEEREIEIEIYLLGWPYYGVGTGICTWCVVTTYLHVPTIVTLPCHCESSIGLIKLISVE